MKNQKQITLLVSGLIVAVLIVGGYLLYRHKQNSAESSSVPAQQVPSVANPGDTTALTPTPPIAAATKPVAKPVDPWDVFQKYLGYLKNHDEAGVTSVLSPEAPQYGNACPMRQGTIDKDCDSFMDAAYVAGSKLKKSDFVNVWQDNKQAILSTNVVTLPKEEENKQGYEKFYLFFTKDAKGTPKFLISHTMTTTITYTADTLEKKTLEAMNSFRDSDEDGLPDIYENCKTTGANPYKSTCSNTSGDKRDSLGDGWWDGVRAYSKAK